MFIIVEGVDKSGKSSLINELSQLLNYPIVKNEFKPTEHKPEFIAGVYAGLYNTLLSCYSGDIILDRSHITEIVYGRIVRSYNALKYFNWLQFEEEKLVKKAVVIYMTANDTTLERRHKEDKEEYINVKQIPHIQQAYRDHIVSSNLEYLQLSSERDMNKNMAEAMYFIQSFKKKYGHK